eukprot:Amastigsp_a175023_54.p3 type:complete len:127 gc:universal Amastigsp_a175023_54:813-433(-)
MLVPLASDPFRERVVLERRQRGIGDHCGLEMEPSIGNVDKRVGALDRRRGATKHLAARERPGLRYTEPCKAVRCLEGNLCGLHRRQKLDRCNERNASHRGKVERHSRDKVVDVDANGHEHIEHLHL